VTLRVRATSLFAFLLLTFAVAPAAYA